MYNNFKAAINSLDVAISTDAKKVIIGVSPLYYSYTKNNTKDAPNDEDKKSFTDYFAVNDIENGYYLIFKMSSDVELNSDNKFNKIEVGTYVAPTDFNLEFVNTTEEILTVKMSYTSKQDIEEAINYFDNYFNTTSAVEIPEAVDGVYSVEYQINKVVAK